MKTKISKIKSLLVVCFCCVLSTTFSQKILSLHPLFTEPDAVLMPGIEGSWKIPAFDLTLSIQRAGDNFYILKYGSESNPSTFEAVFVKIKNHIVLDLSGILPDTLGDDFYRQDFIAGHSLFKVSIKGDTMQLAELNYAWFYNYVLKDNLPLKYEWINNVMLLTLNTGDLKYFLAEQSEEKDFFKDPLIALSFNRDKAKTSTQESKPKATSIANVSQSCKPAFPLKNGWLGGDGDVSVPINATTTLFLFSDTYVGKSNQQSRQEPGMSMVSNSVGVETCLANGDTDVKYFWNKMYTENPEPIFKSSTNRYHYWVQDGFMSKGSLYAIIEKIGSRPGASPGDIFNFSLLGFTLAKVSNPLDRPDTWNIQYIPMPGFGNPSMGIRCHAILGDFIYFVVSRHDKAQVLVRKRLNYIDNPENPFEYFALNKTWKPGLDTNDMDTITRGFRSNTVNYHPDIKQWVMISDIAFMDNKIKMRRAPNLTGPWSDEEIIYEIPEVTPGKPAYNKSNFCYLARECIQYYDSKNKAMLITYDINNPDFSEIKSNPEIYTPKVISVSLKKFGNR